MNSCFYDSSIAKLLSAMADYGVTKSRHFQFKTSFDFSFLFKRHYKNDYIIKYAYVSRTNVNVNWRKVKENMIYRNLETVSDLIQRKGILKTSKTFLFC